jgi:two-component system phosphate regulon response regulator OmpR
MTSKPRILVVDDDPKIRQMLSRYLEEEGFDVTLASTGGEMRDALARSRADLVLLDLVLPGEDGLLLAREIRAQAGRTGIIMVTGRSDMVDTVVGLEVGADDYIAKPFHLREVLARIKSVLRRLQPPPGAAAFGPIEPLVGEALRFDGWRIDFDRREVRRPDGAQVPLTSGEFDLLAVFVRHPGRVLTRDMLMDLTRGRQWEAFDRAIDAQVARLRRKIESNPKAPAIIKSVRGIGYVFAVKPER